MAIDFSIVMSTYNGSAHLHDQLASLSAQELLPVELVVYDDCSTDATVLLLRQFARKAPFPVRIFQGTKNIGYRDAFLAVSRQARGSWIAFCDQDDIWLPEKLLQIEQTLLNSPAVDMVVHDANVVDNDMNRIGVLYPWISRPNFFEPLKDVPFRYYYGFSLCFKRSLLADIPMTLIDERPNDPDHPGYGLAHDQLIPLLANIRGGVAVVADRLALYRRHDDAETALRSTQREMRKFNLRFPTRSSLAQGHIYEANLLSRSDCCRDLIGFVAACNHISSERRRNAQAYFEAMARAYQAQSTLYAPGVARAERKKVWYELVRSGHYWRVNDGRGLGLKSLIRDAVAAHFPGVFQ